MYNTKECPPIKATVFIPAFFFKKNLLTGPRIFVQMYKNIHMISVHQMETYREV